MGFGSEIGMRIVENAFEWLDAPIVRVASENLPVPYSPAIGTKVIPTVDDVIAAVKGFWN
jgi:pyruvate dehydrogenase E1 component beta subunit